MAGFEPPSGGDVTRKHSFFLFMLFGVAVASNTEESVFTALDLQCPEPQLEIIEGKSAWLKTWSNT
jgi:hypothetical protein